MNENIRLRWEKATALGVRYYEVDLDRDLWGEWRLARASLGPAEHSAGPSPGGAVRLPRRGPGADRGHPEATAATPV